jgi:hypothetical protein
MSETILKLLQTYKERLKSGELIYAQPTLELALRIKFIFFSNDL